MTLLPLKGVKLVTIALNVPGPVAAARMVELGATATKVEPPSGDALKLTARAWYDLLTRGQTVITLDLKRVQKDVQTLEQLLAEADLLLTSFRPSALRRLRLDWENVHARYPRLCAVNIIGYSPPREEIPGHDLNYQASLGLLRPPQLPVTLHADLAGAERAVTGALALLLHRERTGESRCMEVSLYGAIRDFCGPLEAGLTTPEGVLGGGFPFYNLYQSSDGWIALGALEPGFVKRLTSELNLSGDVRAQLKSVFRTRTAEEWEKWAQERDLPIAAVRDPKSNTKTRHRGKE